MTRRPSEPAKSIADPFLLIEILFTTKLSGTSACNACQIIKNQSQLYTFQEHKQKHI